MRTSKHRPTAAKRYLRQGNTSLGLTPQIPATVLEQFHTHCPELFSESIWPLTPRLPHGAKRRPAPHRRRLSLATEGNLCDSPLAHSFRLQFSNLAATPVKQGRRGSAKLSCALDHDKYYLSEELHSDCDCRLVSAPVPAKHKLYISCLRGTCNYFNLQQAEIFAVLSVGTHEPYHFPSVKGGYLHLRLVTAADLGRVVQQTASFFKYALARGNVLLTCYTGNTLSWCVLAGYLVLYRGMPLTRVLTQLSTAQPSLVLPAGLVSELRRLQHPKRAGFRAAS